LTLTARSFAGEVQEAQEGARGGCWQKPRYQCAAPPGSSHQAAAAAAGHGRPFSHREAQGVSGQRAPASPCKWTHPKDCSN
jgi:hypothetical protein